MRLFTALAFALLFVLPDSARGDITLDGRVDGDTYGNALLVNWYNGHRPAPDSIYGDFNNQLGTTTIRYGVGELTGSPGTDYFFLYIEAPLYAKNMIWDNNVDWKNDFPVSNTNSNTGLTESDVASYRAHHETHHNPGDMKLDFDGATGSEKLVLVDSNGISQFEADLTGNADNSFGLLGFKDSADYLLDNSISTLQLSLARDTTMSFEFQFALDAPQNQAILDLISNGIEFHMSPERGLQAVPEPSSLAICCVIGLGLGCVGLRNRRRKSRRCQR